MEDPRRRAVKFLEKEIKTYAALSLFLSKKGIRKQVRVGNKKVIVSPSFYNERIRESKKIVSELRKGD